MKFASFIINKFSSVLSDNELIYCFRFRNEIIFILDIILKNFMYAEVNNFTKNKAHTIKRLMSVNTS